MGRPPLAPTRLPGDAHCGPITPKPGRRRDPPPPSLCPPPKCSSHGSPGGRGRCRVRGACAEGRLAVRRLFPHQRVEINVLTPHCDRLIPKFPGRTREPVQLVGRPGCRSLGFYRNAKRSDLQCEKRLIWLTKADSGAPALATDRMTWRLTPAGTTVWTTRSGEPSPPPRPPRL